MSSYSVCNRMSWFHQFLTILLLCFFFLPLAITTPQILFTQNVCKQKSREKKTISTDALIEYKLKWFTNFFVYFYVSLNEKQNWKWQESWICLVSTDFLVYTSFLWCIHTVMFVWQFDRFINYETFDSSYTVSAIQMLWIYSQDQYRQYTTKSQLIRMAIVLYKKKRFFFSKKKLHMFFQRKCMKFAIDQC